jgi:hypothetical protein
MNGFVSENQVERVGMSAVGSELGERKIASGANVRQMETRMEIEGLEGVKIF